MNDEGFKESLMDPYLHQDEDTTGISFLGISFPEIEVILDSLPRITIRTIRPINKFLRKRVRCVEEEVYSLNGNRLYWN